MLDFPAGAMFHDLPENIMSSTPTQIFTSGPLIDTTSRRLPGCQLDGICRPFVRINHVRCE
jgi:hypothetical protein